MKVLVVDDQQVIRMTVVHLLRLDGHECIEAENGEQAIKLFEEHHPDFVLMDLLMPVMDGYEASEKIKQLTIGEFVPIIFLTGVTEQDSLIQCLDHGDDYLVKPINHVLLRAKISVHQRTMELTHQIQAKNSELTVLHQRLQSEHEMGRHVLNHAAERSWQDCPVVRSHLSSMSLFNGDLHLVAPNPKGGVYVFLGDMTGHGLSASIGAVPISQVFFTMCAKAKSVREIARELNLTLKEFLPGHMFCAAVIMEINSHATMAKVWAGGLPPALVLREGLGVVEKHKAPYLPLGILSDGDFKDKTNLLRFQRGDRMIIMSDGILEAENMEAEFFGEQRLLDAIGEGGPGSFPKVIEAVASFGEGTEQSDDISLVEVLMEPIAERTQLEVARYSALPWRLDFEFHDQDLKREPYYLMDHIFKMLPQDIGFVAARQVIQTVLVELYSNALEHGVLQLDSRMKKDAHGFADYYSLRQERLDNLSSGYIGISLDYSGQREGEELRLSVRDSGDGFSLGSLSEDHGMGPWGRGLALVESLCVNMDLSDAGSEITVGISVNGDSVDTDELVVSAGV